MTDTMSTTKKTKKANAAKRFPDELFDQRLDQVQNKDAESILDWWRRRGNGNENW
jgi:hypothetical protein